MDLLDLVTQWRETFDEYDEDILEKKIVANLVHLFYELSQSTDKKVKRETVLKAFNLED